MLPILTHINKSSASLRVFRSTVAFFKLTVPSNWKYLPFYANCVILYVYEKATHSI